MLSMRKTIVGTLIAGLVVVVGVTPALASEARTPSGSILLLKNSSTPSKTVGLNKFYPVIGEIVGVNLSDTQVLNVTSTAGTVKITEKTARGFAITQLLSLTERITVTASDSGGAQTRSVFLPVMPMSPFNSGSVQFNLDSAVLTNDARQVLRLVANEAIAVGLKGIYAAGHADTSGTNSYNLQLSKKRADAVVKYIQKYLDGKGITDIEVGVENMGLYVPLKTRDESRRVEILLYPTAKSMNQ
jgi:outer membrane protein OmpA-like peptidoglycan-associated protein